jgi:hypothetical protein
MIHSSQRNVLGPANKARRVLGREKGIYTHRPRDERGHGYNERARDREQERERERERKKFQVLFSILFSIHLLILDEARRRRRRRRRRTRREKEKEKENAELLLLKCRDIHTFLPSQTHAYTHTQLTLQERDEVLFSSWPGERKC